MLGAAIAQQVPTMATPKYVLVNVFDLHGNVFRDLNKDSFFVRVDGKPVVVTSARYDSAPRRIVIALDVSGSMAGTNDTGKNKWRIAREAAEQLLMQTSSDVPIAVLTFSNRVRDVFHFSQSRDSITKWLREGSNDKDTIRGGTSLFDALDEALKLLQPPQPGDAIYVITDGGDNASHLTGTRLQNELIQTHVRLFAFLLGGRVLPPEESGRSSLEETAIDTGGFVFGISGQRRMTGASWDIDYDFDQRTRDRIKVYTHDLCAQIIGFWKLDLSGPPSNRMNKVKLEIVGKEGKARKDVAFTYTRLLPAEQ